MEALGEGEAQNKYFFEWGGSNHRTFPTFKFDSDNVPIGDSPIYCVGVSWFLAKKSKQFDKYREVKGFDECRGHASGKA